jgi:nucleoid DNA-binding protein
MPAQTLTFAEFKDEVAKRLNGDISKADIGKVLNAFVAEAHDCLTLGYVVTVPGLFKATPVVKAGRKKGTVVRNPFKPDAPEKKLRADEPDKFTVKLSKSSAISGKFPALKSSQGQALYATLTAKSKVKRGK